MKIFYLLAALCFLVVGIVNRLNGAPLNEGSFIVGLLFAILLYLEDLAEQLRRLK